MCVFSCTHITLTPLPRVLKVCQNEVCRTKHSTRQFLCCCDLDPITLTYQPDLDIQKTYQRIKEFLGQGFQKLQTDTDVTERITTSYLQVGIIFRSYYHQDRIHSTVCMYYYFNTQSTMIQVSSDQITSKQFCH